MDSVATHAEVERKFDAEPEQAARLLDALPVTGEARFTLFATYLDTPTLDLLRAGTTLRRRDGGHDAGWHLKRPGGPDERTELHEPPGEFLPESLELEAAKVVGDSVLIEVATLRTDRREATLSEASGGPGTDAGESLGSVCLDAVEATVRGGADSWFEVELELTPGADRALLARWSSVAIACGLEPAAHGSKVQRALDRVSVQGEPISASEVVGAYLTKQADVLREQDGPVRRNEEDAVHKARVATRRLRSALRVFGDLYDPDRAAVLSDELKWAGSLLGAPRDAEVMREHLLAGLDGLEDSAGLPEARAYTAEVLDAEHDAAHQALVEGMDTQRWHELQAALAEFVTTPPLRPAARDVGTGRRLLLLHVADAAARANRRLRRAHRKPERDDRWHDVRKAAKAVRYSIDAVKDAFGDEAAASADDWAQVTETFGALQDSHVARDVIRRLAKDAAGQGVPREPLDALAQVLPTRHDAALAEGQRAYERARDPGALRWLVNPWPRGL